MSLIRRTIVASFALGATSLAPPVAAAGPPGAMPGDATMTCAQIAGELTPYMQQIMPIGMAAGGTAKEVVARGEQRVAEAMPGAVALTMAATASHADPTGIASRGVGQAEMAYQDYVWNKSLAEDKPLADQFAAQTNQLVAQGQEMQPNARLQRLMQLAQEKHCDGQ